MFVLQHEKIYLFFFFFFFVAVLFLWQQVGLDIPSKFIIIIIQVNFYLEEDIFIKLNNKIKNNPMKDEYSVIECKIYFGKEGKEKRSIYVSDERKIN